MVFIKKSLIFLSTLILSLIFINNKTFAQEYPGTLLKLTYTSHELYTENTNTYEYNVYYRVPVYIYGLPSEIEYFLMNNVNLVFQKGINRNTNSYYLFDKGFEPGYTNFTFTITVEKTFINSYFANPYEVSRMFDEFTAIYVPHEGLEDDYNRGYLDGYNQGLEDGFTDGYQVGYRNGKEAGFDEGYLEGYDDGILEAGSEAYNKGYEDGTKASISKFTANLHIWLVPAIIVVTVAGIFVGYRRERFDGD